MKFLHFDLRANRGDIVRVTLDKQANVRLMDDSNFSHYKKGQKHQYYGGLATKSPIDIVVPHSGSWTLVVDLGGYAGTVHASVQVING
jgi:hypothetical protein